jgi:hypothetical protein
MALFLPQQIEHHAPLAAQPHPQITAAAIHIIHTLRNNCFSDFDRDG